MYTADLVSQRSPLAGKPPARRPDRPRQPCRRPRWERAGAALRRAWPALAAYAAARVVGLLGLAAWAWHTGEQPRLLLGEAWDSIWYLRIAEYGYGTVIPSAFQQGTFYDDRAFFPLYPALIRALGTVLPLDPVNVALLIAWTASAVAAWGVFLVGERVGGRRTGWALAVLWGVLPHAVIESMAYTESLLTAFAAWALYAVLTRRWLWAGTLSALAGLTRPTGIAVAAAVGVAAAVELGRRLRSGGTRPTDGWRLWAGVAAAPAGWLGYVLAVGAGEGRLSGYFDVQSGWGSRFDFGAQATHFVRGLVLGQAPLLHYVALGVVGAALVLFLLTLVGRQPLPLVVYSATLLVIALGGSNFFQCKPRFLLPAFPLLLPAAAALARARRGSVAVLLGSLAVFSSAYGAYLLTVANSPP